MSGALSDTERARLDAAYRATTYRIHAPTGAIDLRIGVASPALAALLNEARVDSWAIITACNPGSAALGEAANAAAQERLQQSLAARDSRFLAGENLADGGDWTPEASCLVLGMPEVAAKEIGAAFGQNAVLVGDDGAMPRLLWCR